MKVRRNFKSIYATESDPWNIGNADSDRYNLYVDLITQNATGHEKILDIGCGFGAFLARFQGTFNKLVGVELSAEAVAKGKERFPFIQFIPGSADELAGILPEDSSYDLIVCSDVIYYLNERGKHRLLRSIAERLSPDGIAFIAAWCPGGDYLEYDELRRLVGKYFSVVREQVLESKHAVFIVKAKRRFIAVTIDYETWHPIPPGKTINWENDVFLPTEKLLNICSEEGVKLTIMAEMGEYWWLRQFLPETAKKMENQWQDAIRRGHDVQLHLHPCWLPELGARFENENWYWDWSKAKADDYPGDLNEVIGRCKSALELVLKPVKPDYRANSFRAGAYQAQPFARLYNALTANGITCDTSVYAGGLSSERGYDYRLAYSDHQPYFANRLDPQLKAPPNEQGLVEMPILTWEADRRWFLDNQEGSKFAARFAKYLRQRERHWMSSEAYRRTKFVRKYLGALYGKLKQIRRLMNILLPDSVARMMSSYAPEILAQHEYYVMIGHSKSNLEFEGIRRNFREIGKRGEFQFASLSEMAEHARRELLAATHKNAEEEIDFQVQRESGAILGEERNEAPSYHLQGMIPLDRSAILDLGCGTGYWSDRIASLLPWAAVVGVDAGKEFIEKAKSVHQSRRVKFEVGDFARLSFSDHSFDCVYADNSVEHSFDVDATLQEANRVLREGGILVAAFPSDARNPERICDNHTWKTAPHEVRWRLREAGFDDIDIEERDIVREFGTPPYPPSNNRMMFIRAWKRPAGYTQLDRALGAMHWVYDRLNPEKTSEGSDAQKILAGGYAFCWGYVVSLGEILKREGFSVRWLTMLAKNHPRGRGTEQVDSHEVLLVQIDGKEYILDAMANTLIPFSFVELLKQPGLAKPKENPDTRYQQRGYHLYDTEFWYSRVSKYAIRSSPRQKIFVWRKPHGR